MGLQLVRVEYICACSVVTLSPTHQIWQYVHPAEFLFLAMAELTTFYKNGIAYLFRSHYGHLSSVLRTCIAMFAEKAYEAGLITEQVKGAAIQCSHAQYIKCFSDIYEEFTRGLELRNTILDIQTHYQKLVDILKDLGGPPADIGGELEEKLSTLFGM